jgi:hypothetical protein
MQSRIPPGRKPRGSPVYISAWLGVNFLLKEEMQAWKFVIDSASAVDKIIVISHSYFNKLPTLYSALGSWVRN